MLVLSRKENESIEFPSLGVVIRVIGLTRKRVQLGIDAPISLQVTRGEVSENRSRPAPSIDSVAEHVIGEEFKRLESEFAALAELANPEDQRLARQVASDLIERTERIRRAVTASLRGRDKQLADDLQDSREDELQPCVRQSAAGYIVPPVPHEVAKPRPANPRKRTCVV